MLKMKPKWNINISLNFLDQCFEFGGFDHQYIDTIKNVEGATNCQKECQKHPLCEFWTVRWDKNPNFDMKKITRNMEWYVSRQDISYYRKYTDRGRVRVGAVGAPAPTFFLKVSVYPEDLKICTHTFANSTFNCKFAPTILNF